MRYRTFGGTGLRVSELFLGTMTFGEQGAQAPRVRDRLRPGFPSAFISETEGWVFGAARAD